MGVHSGLTPTADGGAGYWLGGSLFSSCGFLCSKGSPQGISPGRQPGLLYVIGGCQEYKTEATCLVKPSCRSHSITSASFCGPKASYRPSQRGDGRSPSLDVRNDIEAQGWEGGCSHFESNLPCFSVHIAQMPRKIGFENWKAP